MLILRESLIWGGVRHDWSIAAVLSWDVKFPYSPVTTSNTNKNSYQVRTVINILNILKIWKVRIRKRVGENFKKEKFDLFREVKV